MQQKAGSVRALTAENVAGVDSTVRQSGEAQTKVNNPLLASCRAVQREDHVSSLTEVINDSLSALWSLAEWNAAM